MINNNNFLSIFIDVIGENMLKEKINKELVNAMKIKDTDKTLVLRMINSSIKDKEIALRGTREDTNLGDEEIISVLKSLVKSRENSILEYKKAGRDDYVQKEQNEVNIIMSFLPKPYTEDELQDIVKEEVAKVEDKTIKSLKTIIANVKSREDIAKINMSIMAKLIKDMLQ